jgi:hypothetical protein
VENFAYPFGVGSLIHKAVLRGSVRSSRTTHPGINAGRVDPHFLRSVLLDKSLDGIAKVDSAFDATACCNGWLILTLHDVGERPSPYGCTPALLSHALNEARRRGFVIAPIRDALTLAGLG